MSEIKKEDIMKALGDNPESMKQLDKLLRIMNNEEPEINNLKDTIQSNIINSNIENKEKNDDISKKTLNESNKVNLKQKLNMMKMKRLNKRGKGQYMEKKKKRIITPNN